MKEAFEIATSEANASPPARRQAFIAAVLLAVREKELGLAASEWMTAAGTFSGRPEDRTYLDILAAIPWESAGVPDFEATRQSRFVYSRWLEFLEASSFEPVLDQYLFLTLACKLGPMRGDLDDAVLVGFRAGPNLLRYRAGACRASQREQLNVVLESAPNFAEAAFFLARHEAVPAYLDRTWVKRALPLLRTAHDAFPQAPIIAVTLAGILSARNEMTEALALYDQALEIRPSQRDALLGRTIALTYLSRAEEAIATASRLLDLGTWYMGDAYYWRARNLYERRDLIKAAADAAEAKKLLHNTDTLALAGMIAYDQQQRDAAHADFLEARRLRADNCIPPWYLGLIATDRGAPSDAVREFTSAASCYDKTADAYREELSGLPLDLEPASRGRQVAELNRQIEAAARQAGRARERVEAVTRTLSAQ